MAAHNISQADLITTAVRPSEHLNRTGHSTVQVTQAKPEAKTVTPQWFKKVAHLLKRKLGTHCSLEQWKVLTERAVEGVRLNDRVDAETCVARVTKPLRKMFASESPARYETAAVLCIADALRKAGPQRVAKIMPEKSFGTLAAAITKLFDYEVRISSPDTTLEFVF